MRVADDLGVGGTPAIIDHGNKEIFFVFSRDSF